MERITPMVPGHAAKSPALSWSLMRCVFAFEICLFHICSTVWLKMQPGWMAETVYMSVTRTGTAGFMMLAGAILVARRPSPLFADLPWRLRKWFPVLVAVQILYLLVGFATGSKTWPDFGWSTLVEPAWYHAWFFYAILFIYLAVVPMRLYAGWCAALPATPRAFAHWTPIVLLLLVIGWNTLLRGGFHGQLRPDYLLVYAGYAWTGYVLRVSFPHGSRTGWFLFLAGSGTAAFVTAAASMVAGAPIEYYMHRCTVFIAIATIGQFLLLQRLGMLRWPARLAQGVHGLSRLTLGIFVVHPLVIVVLQWPHEWALVAYFEWITLPVAGLVVFILSAATAFLAMRLIALVQSGPASTVQAGARGA